MSNPRPTISCPTPSSLHHTTIMLAHGEGGRLTRRLISEQLLPTLSNESLERLGDAAVLPGITGAMAMTTDSFVVSPMFFPGGDIGSLAVYGTVNDLLMAGADPLWLSLGLILEEGLDREILQRVLDSIRVAADRVGVSIVTGDTKVVPRGAVDQLFINTTGIGAIVEPPPSGPASLQPGDAILVSGPIGRHGIAVLSAREDLEFQPPPQSDSQPLLAEVRALRRTGLPIRAMRDATRGGLAAVLHEWCEGCGHSIVVDAEQIPLTDDVRGVCELLGLDPLHVACEGTMAIAVPADAVEGALVALHQASATGAKQVATVVPRELAPVLVKRAFGPMIPLDEPLGAPLPRIC